MRLHRIILPLLLLGCAPDRLAPPTEPPGEGEPDVALAPLVGVVYDSVTGLPAADVRVEIDGKVLYSDHNGRFATSVRQGRLTVRTVSVHFEPSASELMVPPATVSLALRRLAPLPVACRLEDGGFSAELIDLQGRKSLERWSQSQVVLWTDGSPRLVGSLWSHLNPLDNYHWRVTIADAGDIDRVDWRLYDVDGNLYTGSCTPEHRGIADPVP